VKLCDCSQFIMKLMTWIYVIDFVMSDFCSCRCLYTILFNFADRAVVSFRSGGKKSMLILMLFINYL
jgi:hypothetical protein